MWAAAACNTDSAQNTPVETPVYVSNPQNFEPQSVDASTRIPGATINPTNSNRSNLTEKPLDGKFTTLPDGLRIYKEMTWEELNNPRDLFAIQKTIPGEDFVKLKTYLAEGQARYSRNPKDPELLSDIYTPSRILQKWCRLSVFSREHLIKMASLVYLTRNDIYVPFRELFVDECRQYLDY